MVSVLLWCDTLSHHRGTDTSSKLLQKPRQFAHLSSDKSQSFCCDVFSVQCRNEGSIVISNSVSIDVLSGRQSYVNVDFISNISETLCAYFGRGWKIFIFFSHSFSFFIFFLLCHGSGGQVTACHCRVLDSIPDQSVQDLR